MHEISIDEGTLDKREEDQATCRVKRIGVSYERSEVEFGGEHPARQRAVPVWPPLSRPVSSVTTFTTPLFKINYECGTRLATPRTDRALGTDELATSLHF